jgi:O-antigen/teichoic acid export membrane protein
MTARDPSPKPSKLVANRAKGAKLGLLVMTLSILGPPIAMFVYQPLLFILWDFPLIPFMLIAFAVGFVMFISAYSDFPEARNKTDRKIIWGMKRITAFVFGVLGLMLLVLAVMITRPL